MNVETILWTEYDALVEKLICASELFLFLLTWIFSDLPVDPSEGPDL